MLQPSWARSAPQRIFPAFVLPWTKPKPLDISASSPVAVKRGAGYYFQPTLLAGAKQEDAIVQREVFGPVVSVTEFEDEAQVLNWANDSQYGPPRPSGQKTSDAPIASAHGCSMAAPGQYPFYAGERNAARRDEVIRLRKRYVGLRT